MINVLELFVAALLTLPLLLWYALYIVRVKMHGSKWRAVYFACDVSTIFFIGGAHVLIYEIWGLSLFWLFIVFTLMMLALFTYQVYKKDEEVNAKRAVKNVWRLNFLLFSVGYIVIFLYGLVFHWLDQMAF
ncbi:uncharacterized protein DUF3397 [Salsuginibacillus halophilus]|uniref:Uncharacterized protein DUF3397 n=1 Tax=Salsuginibacillus halophilus TaxID=517424 RepID=A0A2P8HX14_9BACI|nr:DUF3397 domain-containing protein [Salsuginibacillus halophilus]PSL50781.1 uncharacterized protein DUF3397 [Salsuginibacillus halophilus]